MIDTDGGVLSRGGVGGILSWGGLHGGDNQNGGNLAESGISLDWVIKEKQTNLWY